jgi:hypothetical protein
MFAQHFDFRKIIVQIKKYAQTAHIIGVKYRTELQTFGIERFQSQTRKL